MDKLATEMGVRYFTIRGFMGNLVIVTFFIVKVIIDGQYHARIVKAIDRANFSN